MSATRTFVKVTEVREFNALFADGWNPERIALAMDRDPETVRRHLDGYAPHKASREVRGAALVAAYDRTPPSERGRLLEAFGIASRGQLRVVVCRARRRLRATISEVAA